MCRRMFERTENARLQPPNVHTYGRSPVCEYEWIRNELGRENDFSHIPHTYFSIVTPAPTRVVVDPPAGVPDPLGVNLPACIACWDADMGGGEDTSKLPINDPGESDESFADRAVPGGAAELRICC